MGKLEYKDFVKKYILEVGGDEVKNILTEVDQKDLDLFEHIFENICQSFYQDYLDGKLNFIDEQDKIENNNK